MSKIYLFLGLFLISNLFTQCECFHHDDDDAIACFEFDQRQCGGDEWSDDIPLSDNESVREEKMKEYLESKDIDVSEVNLVLNFHDGVCEACHVCPEEHRFFVNIDKEDKAKLEKLELLNLGSVDCD